MTSRKWSASRLLLRRALWGLVLPCLALCGLLVALVLGWRLVLPSDGGGTSSIVEHACACTALMLVGVFPMLAIVFLLEAWFRPLLVPEAIPNLGRSSGCLLTVIIGALLPVVAAALPLGGLHVSRWLHTSRANRPALRPRAAGEPELVEIGFLKSGDIIYDLTDDRGYWTMVRQSFREVGPSADDPTKPFTIKLTGPDAGHLVLYRLRNVRTGDVHEFRNVPVRRRAYADWIITQAGERQIREELGTHIGGEVRRIR